MGSESGVGEEGREAFGPLDAGHMAPSREVPKKRALMLKQRAGFCGDIEGKNMTTDAEAIREYL